jgi:hypothetical protein
LPFPDAEDGPPETVLRWEHAAGREVEAAIVHAALAVLGIGIELDRLAVPGLSTGATRLSALVHLELESIVVLVVLSEGRGREQGEEGKPFHRGPPQIGQMISI